MRSHTVNPFGKKRLSLLKVSIALIVFLFSCNTVQSMERFYSYRASPQISFKTNKIKAEVFFLFEQTLIEGGINIIRRKVISANRYLYEITPKYGYSRDWDFYEGELILFHDLTNNNYLLESVSLGSGSPDIEEVGDEFISELIITPFKAKISE